MDGFASCEGVLMIWFWMYARELNDSIFLEVEVECFCRALVVIRSCECLLHLMTLGMCWFDTFSVNRCHEDACLPAWGYESLGRGSKTSIRLVGTWTLWVRSSEEIGHSHASHVGKSSSSSYYRMDDLPAIFNNRIPEHVLRFQVDRAKVPITHNSITPSNKLTPNEVTLVEIQKQWSLSHICYLWIPSVISDNALLS